VARVTDEAPTAAELSSVGESTTPRDDAAAALRRLGHALVGHECDEAMLRRIAELAERTAVEVEQNTPRSRPIASMKKRLWEKPTEDGEAMTHFPECVVSGSANPMGVAMQVRRDGEEAVADLNLGPAFEGAPRRAHGGIVAAVFDDIMGYVLMVHRVPAFTGRLTVNYRAPVPVGADVTVRARVVRRDGRKLFMAAEMCPADDPAAPICDAEGLFIAIRPDRLGLTPEEAKAAGIA
jgi:acyl-coenzyme A thioesterase PaaI-like protein